MIMDMDLSVKGPADSQMFFEQEALFLKDIFREMGTRLFYYEFKADREKQKSLSIVVNLEKNIVNYYLFHNDKREIYMCFSSAIYYYNKI